MLTTLRTQDGVYTNMQYYNKQRDCAGDVVTYLASYTHKNGYTEMRYVQVQNDAVVSWNT